MEENAIEIQQCPKCTVCHEADELECPACGHVYDLSVEDDVNP